MAALYVAQQAQLFSETWRAPGGSVGQQVNWWADSDQWLSINIIGFTKKS